MPTDKQAAWAKANEIQNIAFEIFREVARGADYNRSEMNYAIAAVLLEARAEALESVSLQGCTFPHDAIGVIHRSARSLRAAAAEMREEAGNDAT